MPYDRDVAYDEELAARIRELAIGEAGLTEKKMFGGLAFLIGGNMAVAQAARVGCWFASIQCSRTSSWRRRVPIRWRCAGGRWEGGCESTGKTFARNGSSPNGSSLARHMRGRYR